MGYVVLAIVVLVVLAMIGILGALRRRDTGSAIGALSRETVKRDRSLAGVGTATPAATTGKALERQVALERRGAGAVETVDRAPVAWTPPDAETVGVHRRQFLNRSIVGFMGLGLSGFGAAAIAYLWPEPKGGFGSKIRVGRLSEIQAEIAKGKGFYYRADGRMWITEYPSGAIEKASKAYKPAEVKAMKDAGVVALYQKCPHLGCRVPNCQTSQWFECPCHGSQYNRVGEKRGGPAPRGMDRFAMTVEGDVLTVDTGTIIPGPPIGTNTTGQEAEGPHCTGGGHSG